MITNERIGEIALNAVTEQIRDLIHDKMGQGDLLSDEEGIDLLTEDEHEAECARLEKAFERYLPDAWEKALRDQIAADIEAHQPTAHPVVCPPSVAWEAGRDIAAAIARHGIDPFANRIDG